MRLSYEHDDVSFFLARDNFLYSNTVSFHHY